MKPPWSVDELLTVLRHHAASDEEVSRELGTRSPNAVGVVRIGVCVFHRLGDERRSLPSRLLLNERLREYLRREDRPRFQCAKCGGTV